MRVLLINPSIENLQHRMYPESWNRNVGVCPPLGLLYLGGTLESRGHQVRILDLCVRPMTREGLAETIRSFMPGLVGISCLTFNYSAALNAARIAKEELPRTITVLGGPQPTMYPQEVAAQEAVDYAAVGDGEMLLASLADDPGAADGIPGLVSTESPKDNGPCWEHQTVDRESLPFPARHLVNRNAYTSIVTKKPPMTSMVTGTGCPFQCIFCSVPRKGRPFSRSPEHAVEEMAFCQGQGFREIMFFDDIFTLDRDRALFICELIRKKGLRLAWDCRTRVDRVDPELLRAMHGAGCFRVQYGLESGSQKVLDAMKKGQTLEQAREAVAHTREAGMLPSASFIIGMPGETPEDIQKTIQFTISTGLAFVQFSIATPFPGSELYRMAMESGLYEKDYWRDFAKNPSSGFIPPYWKGDMPADELRRWQDKAFRSFYYRPGYLLKQIASLRSLPELHNKTVMGLRLAREMFLGR